MITLELQPTQAALLHTALDRQQQRHDRMSEEWDDLEGLKRLVIEALRALQESSHE